MKKRILHQQQLAENSDTDHAAMTGEHCPLTGWWALMPGLENRRFIAEGSIMPTDKDRFVLWTLVVSEARSHTPLPTSSAVGLSFDRY